MISGNKIERRDVSLAPSQKGFRRSAPYVWAVCLAVVATAISFFFVKQFAVQTLAPVMVGIVILACFSTMGPTIVCGILGSIGWLLFVAVDVHRLIQGHELIWREEGTPSKLFRFASIAIFISASYFARRRAELMLQKAQQRLVFVLDETDIGTWDYEVASAVFRLSPRMQSILGVAPKEAPTHAEFLELIPVEDRPIVIDVMNSSIQWQTNYGVEHRFIGNDGNVRRIVMRGKPFVGSGGKVERIIGVGMDASEGANALAKLAS